MSIVDAVRDKYRELEKQENTPDLMICGPEAYEEICKSIAAVRMGEHRVMIYGRKILKLTYLTDPGAVVLINSKDPWGPEPENEVLA